MKEKSFRFRESFGIAVKAMNDKQAGKFVKGLCDYIFDGKNLDTNDSTIKASFCLVKMALEQDKLNSINGRKGGIATAELRKREKQQLEYFTTAKEQNCPFDEMLQTIFEMVANEVENGNGDKGGSVGK